MKFVAARYAMTNVIVPSTENLPTIQLEDVGSGTGALVNEPKTLPPAGQNRFRSGDVLFGKLRPYLAKSWLVDRECQGSGEFLCLRPAQGYESTFLRYVVLSRPWIARANEGAYGSKMPRTSWEQLSGALIPCPSMDEQRRIADFLDDRVARIDQIIAGRRQQADALYEQFRTRRQLMIRGAGLTRRSVPGWLGAIAEDWQDRRLGQLADFYAGAGFPPDEQGHPEGDFPFVKVSDLAGANLLREVGTAINWIEASRAAALGARPAPRETVLFPKVGAALLTNSRAVAVREVVFDNNVMGVKFREGDVRFWFHVLSCIDMGEISNPGPVPSIGREGVAELRLPMPALQVQKEIGQKLDHQLVEVAEHQKQMHRSIGLLQEYKQSLITAAVTGELDVTTASSRIPE